MRKEDTMGKNAENSGSEGLSIGPALLYNISETPKKYDANIMMKKL